MKMTGADVTGRKGKEKDKEKEKDRKEKDKEKEKDKDKDRDFMPGVMLTPRERTMPQTQMGCTEDTSGTHATGRAFIRSNERPLVGRRALLRQPDDE